MASFHHLKITLKNIKPPIWREVLVPSDIRLDRLHQVIQIAMGWADYHLHEFSNGVRGLGELSFGPKQDEPEFDFGFGPRQRDEKKHTLSDLAPNKGDKFRYWYDFGDDWHHDVRVKSVGEPTPTLTAPVCIKAAGACPPEDCGGPWGYAHLVEVMGDAKHEEHEEMLEWLGGDFSPDRYDIDQVNRDLAALASRWRRTPRKTASRRDTKL